MKKKLTALLLCTMVAAAGCGSASSGKKAESEAASSAAAANDAAAVSDAASEEEISEQINLSSAEDVAAAGLTDSEIAEMAFYLDEEGAESWADYPEDELWSEDDYTDEIMMDVESAPTAAEMPASGQFDSFLELADYKGLEILMPADAELEEGLTANIDYDGTIDGEEFDTSSDSDYDLRLGDGSFIEGFEEQLKGHKSGDEFSFSVPYPEDYFDDGLAGKTADFTVKINAVYKETPDVVLYDQVVDKSKVLQYPQELLDKWRSSMITDIESWGFETYSTEEAMIEDSYGSVEAFDSNVRYWVKSELVFDSILDKEGITEDSDEFANAIDKALYSYGGLTDMESAVEIGLSEAFVKLTAKETLCQDILVNYCTEAR